MIDDTPTFAQFLAKKKLPYTPWGDLLRQALEDGSLPEIRTWGELRRFALVRGPTTTKTQELRATWLSYARVLKLTSPQRVHA